MAGSEQAELDVGCCIAGGGPAGMMLGFLLARAGIDVLVLEKHADFFRDFRGDTIHPSTLEVMHELGLLDAFLRRPHQDVRQVRVRIGDEMFTVADFSHLPTRCKFIAFMPQWDFLDFLAEQARRYPAFKLMMMAEAVDVVEDDGRIAGLRVRTPEGERIVRARLTVGADGRHSTVRAKAQLTGIDLGAPMDALWLRISRQPGDPPQILGTIQPRRIFVMLDRGDYWQCAFIIAKGTFERMKEQGLDAFRAEIVRLVPWLGPRVHEIASWDDVKLLTVAVDRLERWYRSGLLCIGDAAHAMSPIGGVGINLAVQDAVAAANILYPALRKGVVTQDDLARVQRRRELPTRVTQQVQLAIQNRMISNVLTTASGAIKAPAVARWLDRYPVLRRIPARLIGIGFRPEHARTPDMLATS